MHFQRESSEMEEVPKYAFDMTKYADGRLEVFDVLFCFQVVKF